VEAQVHESLAFERATVPPSFGYLSADGEGYAFRKILRRITHPWVLKLGETPLRPVASSSLLNLLPMLSQTLSGEVRRLAMPGREESLRLGAIRGRPGLV
jgi:hypothetical protein